MVLSKQLGASGCWYIMLWGVYIVCESVSRKHVLLIRRLLLFMAGKVQPLISLLHMRYSDYKITKREIGWF
jgi:hypothetical protein